MISTKKEASLLLLKAILYNRIIQKKDEMHKCRIRACISKVWRDIGTEIDLMRVFLSEGGLETSDTISRKEKEREGKIKRINY